MDLARLRGAVTAQGGETSDFDLAPDVRLPEGRKLRPAAVLIAVSDLDQGGRLWLTKRSSKLKHHPGQIAFPGGKLDPSDTTPQAAALREAHEEIGLPPRAVNILGTLPPHETVSAFRVIPVLAQIIQPFDAIPEEGEVEEVFTVPLPHVLNPDNYIIERRRWRGQWRQFYTVPYGPYYIWGATARMLRALADRL